VNDFLPTASLENLRRRAQLLERLRRFFHERHFWEVETPVLSHDTVVDRFLDPMAVPDPRHAATSPPASGFPPRPLWLQTSPEFGMKRLLAAGADAIFQVTRAFRCDEIGPLHNPEFTMVEWYRVGDTLAEGMQLLAELCEALLSCGPPESITYRDAFLRHLRIDPLTASLDALRQAAEDAAVIAPESLYAASLQATDLPTREGLRDEWLHLLLAERVQPHLGRERPAILYHYPARQAALARVVAAPDPVAERFELYVHGMELANGYHELLDADQLADRQRAANADRLRDGKPTLPEDNRLLAAMRQGLPPCAGVALGFDRLAMVALGATHIEQVIAFPFPRA
jgi:lysyl-tRNA synthetase class 2